MSGIVTPSYKAGFASPQRGMLKYPNLWRGCVGAWSPLLGPTGATLRDQSVYGNHGTLTNMDPDTDWVVSGGNHALDFDGSNDYVNITPASCNITDQFTLFADVTVGVFGGYEVIMMMRNDGTSSPFDMSRNSATALRSGIVTAGNTSIVTWESALADLETARLVITRNDRTLTAYKNGVSLGTGSNLINIGPQATSPRLMLGAQYAGVFASYMDMKLRDVRIYNRLLKDSEIRMLSSSPGIAYETNHRRSYKSAAAPATNRRRRLLIGS